MKKKTIKFLSLALSGAAFTAAAAVTPIKNTCSVLLVKSTIFLTIWEMTAGVMMEAVAESSGVDGDKDDGDGEAFTGAALDANTTNAYFLLALALEGNLTLYLVSGSLEMSTKVGELLPAAEDGNDPLIR